MPTNDLAALLQEYLDEFGLDPYVIDPPHIAAWLAERGYGFVKMPTLTEDDVALAVRSERARLLAQVEEEREANERASHNLEDPATRILAYAGMITCDNIIRALRAEGGRNMAADVEADERTVSAPAPAVLASVAEDIRRVLHKRTGHKLSDETSVALAHAAIEALIARIENPYVANAIRSAVAFGEATDD